MLKKKYRIADDKISIILHGVINAFEVDGKGNEIRNSRFYRVYLHTYIISIVTFLSVIGIYFKRALKKYFFMITAII